MLNLNCVICAELFTASDDVYVTPCGHLFHNSCLKQWLERSKTCPQCRNKCTERNICRVYFNLANLDVSRIDVGSLQEQLDNANLQLKIKEKEVNKAEQANKELKDRQKKCLKTIAGLEQQIQKNEFIILTYSEQIKILKTETSVVDNLRKEVKALKQQIATMEGLSAIISAGAADTDRLLQNESDPRTLSTWVTTLKRELRQSENKKSDIRNVLKVVQSDLRKEIELKRKHEERISQLESENYQMKEKIKALDETTVAGYDTSNNTIGLNNNIWTPSIKTERRSTISPTIKENIKRIEDSNSPYLNIKSSSVGLAPLLTRPKPSLETLQLSPIKNRSAAKLGKGSLRQTSSDLSEKYSIFKKPRLGLSTAVGASTSGSIKPLSSNYVFNGFGGSEKIDPFAKDTEIDEMDTMPVKKAANHLTVRLKSGDLRNFKFKSAMNN